MNPLTHLTTALAGRYDLARELGEGGMATVYLARDVKHDRDVAIKVLKLELGAVLGVERFLSEIKVTANLQHPNLLPPFDSGEAGGLLFYVMPFVEGETLRARLDREKQLPVDEAVRIATAIAGALAYAHERGVIHRDLKPENILLQAGQPVIADFGIALTVSNAGGARVTQTGLSLGTPQYMSPEQATGDRVIDARSDLYSLAAMTYEMLVGDPPHVASTAQAIVAKLLTERPASVQVARPTVGDAVAYAIERGLEKLPADRWSGAAEFAEALGLVGSNPQFVAPDRIVYGAPGNLVMTAPFSLRSRTVTGPGERVAEGIWQGLGGAVGVAASRNGVLALQSGTVAFSGGDRDVIVVTEKGVERPTVLPRRRWDQARVSPDGKRMAGAIWKLDLQRDVWISELQSGITERLTTDSVSALPAWTRDGQAVVYTRNVPGVMRLQSWPRNGGSTLISDKAAFGSISPGPAGGYWAFSVPSPNRADDVDIWIARDDSLPTPRPFIATAGVDEVLPSVSPNGRLLAYVSAEGGQNNVYIQPIPGPGTRVRVSVDGGLDPAWSPDGTALFYRTLGSPGTFMRATISDRPRLEATRRDSLFPFVYSTSPNFVTYDVLPGGREFLMLKQPQAEQRDAVVTVIVNWPATLGRARAVAPAPVP